MSCDFVDCRVPPERHNSCAAASISKCWGWPLQHQHTPKRSQGGKEAHVMLCAGHHGGMDCSGRYEGLRLRDYVFVGGKLDGSWRIYTIEDRDSLEVLVEIELLDMGGGDPPGGAKITTDGGPSSPPPMPGSSRESRASC